MSSLDINPRMMIDVISALVNNFTAVLVHVWQNRSHGVATPCIYLVTPVCLGDRGRCTQPPSVTKVSYLS